MTQTVERRYVDLEDPELREGSGGTRLFTGYASVFNQWADIGGMFREQVSPGAFTKTIREADVPFVFNHDSSTVMARSSNGMLRLSEDKKGLRVEADLDPSDSDAARLITKIEQKNVAKMSFAFRTIKDEWNDGTKPPQRKLLELALADVSPVTQPAYAGTSAKIRAEARALLEARGFEVPPDEDDEITFARTLEMLMHSSPDEGELDPGAIRAAIEALTRFLPPAEPTEPQAQHSGRSLPLDLAQLRLRHRRANAA